MGSTNAVLMALFVVGFALFAYGTTYRDPAAGARVSFASMDAEDVPAGAEVVDYRDLPEPVRQAFDRAESTGAAVSLAAARASIDAGYVEYDGTYYRITVLPGVAGGASVELSLGLVGLVLSALSAVVYLLQRREAYG